MEPSGMTMMVIYKHRCINCSRHRAWLKQLKNRHERHALYRWHANDLFGFEYIVFWSYETIYVCLCMCLKLLLSSFNNIFLKCTLIFIILIILLIHQTQLFEILFIFSLAVNLWPFRLRWCWVPSCLPQACGYLSSSFCGTSWKLSCPITAGSLSHMAKWASLLKSGWCVCHKIK